MHAVLIDFFTQCYCITVLPVYGRPTCVMAEKETSTSESSSLLSTVRERLLLAKSAKLSEGERISARNQEVNPNVKQLLRERKNSVHLSRAGVIEINV